MSNKAKDRAIRDLLDATIARCESVIYDECPKCAGTTDPPTPIEMGLGIPTLHKAVRHRSWCPAGDPHFERMAAKAGATIAYKVPVVEPGASPITWRFFDLPETAEGIWAPLEAEGRLEGKLRMEPHPGGKEVITYYPDGIPE